MGNRILKESICTSENVDSLSAFHETFFYRLIVNCDDYGRMDARPKILASRLFPLKDIRSAQVEDALRALTSAELVTLYEVNGKPFLQMNTWDRHQQVRAKKSKYPSPDEGIGYQLISDDSKCPRNPIQNESESESKTKAETAQARNARFDRFWAAYPRKEAKPRAKSEFDKLSPDEVLLERMLSAIARWKGSAQWQEDGGKYIPHPATWIHQKRWEDDPPKKSGQQYEQRDYSTEEDDTARLMAILQGDMRA